MGHRSQSDHKPIWKLCDNQKKSPLPLRGRGHMPGPTWVRSGMQRLHSPLPALARCPFALQNLNNFMQQSYQDKPILIFYLFPMYLQALEYWSIGGTLYIFFECLSFLFWILMLQLGHLSKVHYDCMILICQYLTMSLLTFMWSLIFLKC